MPLEERTSKQTDFYTLQGTALAGATAETIRTQLLKIGALISVSLRRVRVQLASSFPLQELFYQVWQRLRQLPSG